MKRQIAGIFLLSLLAGAASAVTEYNKTVAKVGAQGSTVYFTVQNGFVGGCLYNVVYVPSETTFGKFAYAQLLTAKATNIPLSRIDYGINASSVCVLTLVEINE